MPSQVRRAIGNHAAQQYRPRFSQVVGSSPRAPGAWPGLSRPAAARLRLLIVPGAPNFVLGPLASSLAASGQVLQELAPDRLPVDPHTSALRRQDDVALMPPRDGVQELRRELTAPLKSPGVVERVPVGRDGVVPGPFLAELLPPFHEDSAQLLLEAVDGVPGSSSKRC